MTQQEADRRCLEIDVQRQQLEYDQALNHARRLDEAARMAPGSVSPEELEDSRVMVMLRGLDVEECQVKLDAYNTSGGTAG